MSKAKNKAGSFSPVVYLCGGINGLADAECKDWREYAKTRLSRTLDPMRRDYRGRESECVDEIVRGDIIDIDNSHVVLAMCPKPSWGTAMEIFYAYDQSKPVVAVVPSGVPVSPWLTYHSSKIFNSLDAAINYILENCEW